MSAFIIYLIALAMLSVALWLLWRDRPGRLMKALGHLDHEVSNRARDKLYKARGDGRYRAVLIKGLSSDSPVVRRIAASTLGDPWSEDAIAPLADALAGTLGRSDPDFRRTVVEALGQIRDSRVIQPLVDALSDSDSRVRGRAAYSLSHFKDNRVVQQDSRIVQPLVNALGDADSGVRMDAARALGELKDPRTIEPLEALLQAEDHDVRKVAARALEQLRPTPATARANPEDQRDDDLVKEFKELLQTFTFELMGENLGGSGAPSLDELSRLATNKAGKVLAQRHGLTEQEIAAHLNEALRGAPGEKEGSRAAASVIETCCVCGRTPKSIGSEVREMQARGVVVINHDLIAFCHNCGVAYCSKHYDLNELAGTHSCPKCHHDLHVNRHLGYFS